MMEPTRQPGAAVPDGPVNAQASFTTGAGFITVTLSNLLANPHSAGQLLSGLAFTVSENETTGMLGSTSANLRTVNRGGSFVDLGPASETPSVVLKKNITLVTNELALTPGALIRNVATPGRRNLRQQHRKVIGKSSLQR
jgi:hypothetical protein